MSAPEDVPLSGGAVSRRTIMSMTSAIVALAPSPTLLDDLVRRIRTVIEPKRIILFGSAARGTMGPDSDLDVLVIVADGTHRLRTSQAIYRALAGFAHPKDIVVVTEDDVTQDARKLGTVITPALEEGRELYACAS